MDGEWKDGQYSPQSAHRREDPIPSEEPPASAVYPPQPRPGNEYDASMATGRMFQSPTGLWNAQRLLAVVFVMSVLGTAVVDTLAYRLDFTDAALLAMSSIVGLLSLASIAAIVVGVLWCYRVHANLVSMGVQGLRWKSGWAAGGWFIPLANFVIPFLVLSETWRATFRPDHHRDAKLPAWIGIYWAAWVGQAAVMLIAGFVIGAGAAIDAFEAASAGEEAVEPAITSFQVITDWIAAGLMIAAGILWIRLGDELTFKQEELHAKQQSW